MEHASFHSIRSESTNDSSWYWFHFITALSGPLARRSPLYIGLVILSCSHQSIFPFHLSFLFSMISQHSRFSFRSIASRAYFFVLSPLFRLHRIPRFHWLLWDYQDYRLYIIAPSHRVFISACAPSAYTSWLRDFVLGRGTYGHLSIPISWKYAYKRREIANAFKTRPFYAGILAERYFLISARS